MTNQQLTTFTDFVKSKYIIIPTNQRGYAWKKENFQQLIEDVRKLPEQYVHYAGPILFLQRETQTILPTHARVTPISIEDGQQRSTTLFLVARVLLDYFQTHIQDDTNVIQTLITTIFQVNRGDNIRRLKSENPTFDKLLEFLLEKKGEEPELVTSSMKRLSSNYKHISKLISGLNSESASNLFYDLFERLKFVAIDLKHEGVNASIAFHTTNSRGVPLKSFDIVKNHLMYYVEQREMGISQFNEVSLDSIPVSISKEGVERAWFKAIHWLENHGLGDKEDEYLGFCTQLLMVSDGKLEKQKLPNLIEEYFFGFLDESQHGAVSFDSEVRALETVYRYTHLWESLVELYGLILNRNKLNQIFSSSSEWSNWAHSILKIHALKKPGIVNELLTVSRLKFSPKENEEIADLAYKLIMRVFAIQKGRRVDHQATAIRKMVNGIFSGDITAEKVQEFLVGVIIESGEINDCIRMLFGESPLNYASKPTELGWFLTEYEYYLCNAKGTTFARFDKGNKTIEHILPQQGNSAEHQSYYELNEEWQKNWTEVEYRLSKHRVGNLVMTNHNSVLGNKPYAKKCNDKSYSYSSDKASKSEQQLVELFPKWDEPSLHKREALLLHFFMTTFRIEHPRDYVELQLTESLLEGIRLMGIDFGDTPKNLRFSEVQKNQEEQEEE